MPRATHKVASRRRRKKILKKAKGYYGARSKLYRTAKEAVNRALVYAYRDRRQKKRNFRRLWIVRINAAARLCGLSYSLFLKGLKRKGINLDRKSLAEIAVKDSQTFTQLAELVKSK
jgi:large subunit ribosomal protein L20